MRTKCAGRPPNLGPDPGVCLPAQESIARIEGIAFELLAAQGASSLTGVLTAGGGASNPVWTSLRTRVLGVPVEASPHVEASYGAAVLARKGITGRW